MPLSTLGYITCVHNRTMWTVSPFAILLLFNPCFCWKVYFIFIISIVFLTVIWCKKKKIVLNTHFRTYKKYKFFFLRQIFITFGHCVYILYIIWTMKEETQENTNKVFFNFKQRETERQSKAIILYNVNWKKRITF